MAIPTSANGNKAASAATSGSTSVAELTLSFPLADANSPLNRLFTVVGWTGTEGISQIFHHELELVANPSRPIDFDQILGQLVTMEIPLPDGKRRIHGLISRLTQERHDQTHARFRLEFTSRLWYATKIARSRVFQDLDAVEIIKQVIHSLPVPTLWTDFRIQGKYPKRPYCVQYRETDFNFVSRLMEEEGIYYFFDHDDFDRTEHLVISDTPLRHPDLPDGSFVHLDPVRGGDRKEDRITDWRKTQEVRAEKVTLWDHSFELPQQHLEATKRPLPKVRVGSTMHNLETHGDANHEIYDYPGNYAHHFDSVNRGGGNQEAKLQGVFEDNKRVAAVRMEQETLPGLIIHGASRCRQFRAGYVFTLDVLDHRHPSKELAEGQYLITSVKHRATQSLDRSGSGPGFQYENQFTCIPVDLPFRPLRLSRKPVIQGTQTAVVIGTGADGEEIFTDKYGRVRVRFFWDRRDLKGNADSCWIRVAQPWAGKRWGTSFIPRIGQEVVVAFEEGDPDKPIIIGSVYNADQMPPYLGDGLDAKHANDPKVSGVKTCTTPGGNGFNEIRFDDTKGKEQVFIRSQNALDVCALGSQRTSIGGHCHSTICGDAKETIGQNKVIEVQSNFQTYVTDTYYIRSDGSFYVSSANASELKAKPLVFTGVDLLLARSNGMIVLQCGDSSLTLTRQGIWLNGPQVLINSGKPPDGTPPDRNSQDDLKGTAPADDSKPGFVSNPNAGKKAPSANGASAGQAGG